MAAVSYCTDCGTANPSNLVACSLCGLRMTGTARKNPVNSYTLRAKPMAVFDIDMTLLDNEQRYKDAKRAGIIDKDSKPKRKTKFETPGKAFKRAQEFLFDSARLDKDRLIPGAADFVNSLVEQGYIIAYCTARRLTFYEVTKRQLEKKGFPMMMDDMGRELLFMKSGGSDTSAKYKQKVVTELNSSYDVRFFFDDMIENLQAVAQVGVPGLYPSIKAYTDISAKSNPAPNCGCGQTPCVTYGTRSNPEEYSENYMVPRDIHRLGKAADRLEDTYEDGQEVPEWWKSKMSVAAKDADTLADALDYVDERGNPPIQDTYSYPRDFVEEVALECPSCGARDIEREDVAIGDKFFLYVWCEECGDSAQFEAGEVPEGYYDEKEEDGFDAAVEADLHRQVEEWMKKKKNPPNILPIYAGEPTSKFTNKGMVSAEVQIGRNLFKDIGEAVQSIYRGLIGGRTTMAERRMAMAMASMQKELSERAAAKGGNAVANLKVDYEMVDQSITMTLIATADAIKMTRPPKSNPGHSRGSLPFRPTSDCFLTYKGKLVAKDMGHYIAFPGGGVDPGESPKAAAKREVMEEVGAVLKGDLKPMGDISWVWNPEWADSPKRKKRYQQFQGEQVYFFTGEVEKFVKPTSDEGDAWSGKKLMKFSDAIAYLQAEKANLKYPNQAKYIDYQIACLSQIQKAKGKMTGAQYRAGVKKMLEARANPLPLMGLSVQVSGYRNAAGAFVMKGKKFLILQRSKKETSKHGLWELPGGKVEEGETPRQAAVIEAKEEAGLDIKLKANLGPHHDDKKKKTYHAYIATPKKGQKVKLSEEHSDYKWVTPEEVLAMPKKMVSHHLLYFLKKEGETIRNNPRKNPSQDKKIEKGKKLYKHMNGKEPEKITKQKVDMGDVWYQVGEGGCWQIGYMSGKETGSSNQKYTHTFNEETQDGNFPKLYATMPENGKPLLIIQGGTWKIKTDDKGVAWIYD
jgi:8-oxo-dGTP diphosphatase